MQCYISYGNQSFGLHCKSKDWFLYYIKTLGWMKWVDKKAKRNILNYCVVWRILFPNPKKWPDDKRLKKLHVQILPFCWRNYFWRKTKLVKTFWSYRPFSTNEYTSQLITPALDMIHRRKNNILLSSCAKIPISKLVLRLTSRKNNYVVIHLVSTQNFPKI